MKTSKLVKVFVTILSIYISASLAVSFGIRWKLEREATKGFLQRSSAEFFNGKPLV